MPATAHDSTLPPLSASTAKLCPRCRAPAPEGATWEARCPEHGLAFVEARALADGVLDPLLGATLAGRFTVLSRVGSGSMGSVYRARQAAIGRDVALKIVRRDRAYDPETKARFEREARAVSMLKSPHTVTAFDFGEAEDGSWFLALEMLEGETLGERLRRVRRLPWPEAIRLACDALRSLAEAHSQGIIHRDLKPDNLFLAKVHDPSGEREICKILDFGIAKWVGDGNEQAPVDQLETLAGTVFGTPRYMSPEQAQGTTLDARSDLYSLGVLLFQMLAGRAPFVDDDAVVVMAKHIKDPPPDFEAVAPGVEIPPALETVVKRALAKAPTERQASAEQMLAELEQALSASRAVDSGVRPHVENDDLPESLRVAERRAWLLGALLVAALCALAGLGIALWSRPFKHWGSSSPASAALGIEGEPVRSLATSGTGPLPTPAPPAPDAGSVENSASRAPAPEPLAVDAAASSSSSRSTHAAPSKKPKAGGPGALERRGNERYGRFE
jgi:serine/threonine-protein kinase